MPSIATYTLGCKVNQSETSQIEALLLEHGYQLIDFNAPADYYIINTCSVTHVADRKSRHYIRRAKRNNPQAKVVVTGCFTEKDAVSLKGLDIDIIINNKNKSDNNKWLDIFPKQSSKKESSTVKVRRMLKIQDGCSTFCSYCIVPHLRSNKTSIPLPQIIELANNWVKAGTREIVLTGINLGNYNFEGNGLLQVIRALSEIKGLFRIRISSLELPDVSDELIREIRTNPKVCKHLHLPLQSGSNNILNKMRRPYARKDFIEKVATLRKDIPDISITTDVIVGFPGETPEDFLSTKGLIEQLSFARLHVFKYSARPGTPSASFTDKVPHSTIQKRSKELLDLGNDLMNDFANKYLNQDLEVLFEEEKKGIFSGLTGNYIKVLTERAGLLGQLKTVNPKKIDTNNTLIV